MTSGDELMATVQIPVYRRDGSIRAYAIVDAADADWVNQWRWYDDGQGYVSRKQEIGGRRYTLRLHRELLGLKPGDGFEGDHKDLNKLNYRRSNLRSVPFKGRPNSQNVGSVPGSSSRYRGVTWDKDGNRWRAQVYTRNKNHYLGLFDSEEAAAEAARLARLRMMPYAVEQDAVSP